MLVPDSSVPFSSQVKAETEEAREAFFASCQAFQAECSLDAVARQREGIEAETALLSFTAADLQSELDALASSRAEAAALIVAKEEEIERRKATIRGADCLLVQFDDECCSSRAHRPTEKSCLASSSRPCRSFWLLCRACSASAACRPAALLWVPTQQSRSELHSIIVPAAACC